MELKIFKGVPNGKYSNIDELFAKNKTLLLYRFDDDNYKVLRKFKTPNKCLLFYRKLQKLNLTDINNFKIHTIIKNK